MILPLAFFFFLIYLFISDFKHVFISFWLCRNFVAEWVFSSCGEWGLLFAAAHGLLSSYGAWTPEYAGLVVEVHRLRCSV